MDKNLTVVYVRYMKTDKTLVIAVHDGILKYQNAHPDDLKVRNSYILAMLIRQEILNYLQEVTRDILEEHMGEPDFVQVMKFFNVILTDRSV